MSCVERIEGGDRGRGLRKCSGKCFEKVARRNRSCRSRAQWQEADLSSSLHARWSFPSVGFHSIAAKTLSSSSRP